jgi:hypothetical protein
MQMATVELAGYYQPEEMVRRRQRDILAITIVLLNVADLLVTQYILRTHPASREGNGLVAAFIMSPWAWVPKVGLPIGVLASASRKKVTVMNYYGLFAVWGIYWGVIAWNLHIIVL